MLNLIIGYVAGILTIYLILPWLGSVKIEMEQKSMLKITELQLKKLQIQNRTHDFNMINYLANQSQDNYTYKDIDEDDNAT